MAAEASAATPFDWAPRTRGPKWLRASWRMARQYPLGDFGLVVMILFVFVGLFGTTIAPYNPRELSVGTPLAGPSTAHLFGVNQLGQDVFSRVVAGAHYDLEISFIAVFFGVGLGALLGMVAGYYSRWVDYLIQRSGEAFAAFPSLVLYFLLIAAFGRGVNTIILAIGVGALFGGNRVIRSATIIERNKTYIEAARATGCSELRIFFRHVVPNVIPLTIIIMSSAFGAAILAESALSFLGLGVAPGTPSWGIDMSGANLSIARLGHWHVVMFPGIAISLVVLGANLLGDALRDILDPRLRH
jgi:peptide/nickel transport system permease protein